MTPDDAADAESWRVAVTKVLGDRAFDDVLVSHTRGGLEVQPLYTRSVDRGEPPLPATGTRVRGDVDPHRLRHGWDIRQRHQGEDADEVRAAIIDDLEGGVTSIELGAPATGWTSESLARSLDGVDLGLAPVALAPHADLSDANRMLELWDSVGPGPAVGAGLGLDPLGEAARTGTAAGSVAECAELVASLSSRSGLVGMVVDVERYVDAGADEVQELAWGTATGVAYLRALEAAGLDVDRAARHIAFRWSTSAEQFVTVAKLRAARRLWARVLEASGVSPDLRTQHQQAVTPGSMYSRLDPSVNLIRGTIAALAAVVGGADSVTIAPFDRHFPRSGSAGRRSARNTQMLLVEESHIGRTVDPSGGSWFVESLTDRMAHAAWDRFRLVERSGGMAAVMDSGSVGDELEVAWSARLAALGTGREAMVGVNRFPDLDEEIGPLAEHDRRSSAPGALPVRRPARPFEDLRDAADRYRSATGHNLVVHLVGLGSPDRYWARLDWVTNMLAVGGVTMTAPDPGAIESPIASEAAFSVSGSTVAVVCGPDDLYETRGESTAIALKEAGASVVAVVGAPVSRRADLTRAGVDEFWHDGIDVLAALHRVHTALGVT